MDVENERAYVRGFGLCGVGDPSLYVSGTVDIFYTCPSYTVLNQASVDGERGDLSLEVSGAATILENGFTIYDGSRTLGVGCVAYRAKLAVFSRSNQKKK